MVEISSGGGILSPNKLVVFGGAFLCFALVAHIQRGCDVIMDQKHFGIGKQGSNPTLLIAIAFYFVPSRLIHLRHVLMNFESYTSMFRVKVTIDTTGAGLHSYLDALQLHLDCQVRTFSNLSDPFDLAGQHRRLFVDTMKNFDWYMYLEDDILIPLKSMVYFMNSFEKVWSKGFSPGFFRVEEVGGKFYASDLIDAQETVSDSERFDAGDQEFVSLVRPYHALWILPASILQQEGEHLLQNPPCLETRETYASFPWCSLHHKPAVPLLPDGRINPVSWVWHLPNNYAKDESRRLGKVQVLDVAFSDGGE